MTKVRFDACVHSFESDSDDGNWRFYTMLAAPDKPPVVPVIAIVADNDNNNSSSDADSDYAEESSSDSDEDLQNTIARRAHF